MIERRLLRVLRDRLDTAPVVCLLGARQVGKTTLAHELVAERHAVYLDLESEADCARLAEPELYLSGHSDKLVILDEVQRAPNIFGVLRGLVDKGRREGRRVGRFLLLGSASVDLLRQSGESLAGRISFLELAPLDLLEVNEDHENELWSRGGFPDSFLAADESLSLRWRQDFIQTYLERDIPNLGPRIAAETLRRFWTMLAHRQAAQFNAAHIARGLGVTGKTVASYLDLMVDLFLVRRLQPWHGNISKRLVRSPKIFLRDSGVAHALLGIRSHEALLGHPVVGSSYEAFVVESLLTMAPEGSEASYFRSAAGAEIDLLLGLPSGERWAIEVKRSLAPRLSRGFHAACGDVHPTHQWVVYPGDEVFPLSSNAFATSLRSLCEKLSEAGGN
jgi:uncharacterized protein